jgi:hypothetical protein
LIADSSKKDFEDDRASQREKRSDIPLSTPSSCAEDLGFYLEPAVMARNGERIALKNFEPREKTSAICRIQGADDMSGSRSTHRASCIPSHLN